VISRCLFVCAVFAAVAASAQSTLSFTVSMPQPAAHFFHVEMRCDGLKGEMQDFKLPAWSPGYYRLLDYEKYVQRFAAENGAGHPLPWEKTTPNTWRVAAGNANTITLRYDVTATSTFGVQNFVDEARAYLSPAGVYMHPADMLAHPTTVSIHLPPGWTRIATGLDPVPGRANTYRAADFDILYDSPTLMGNQELQEFTAGGRPHHVAIENVPESVSRLKMLGDLKVMVEAATRLIGDVPYQHYTFLMMGTGNGGIEHLNSASISFNGKSLETPEGYVRWLSYVAHEYFHNFNVKRIRPIALGPFDYDRENFTNMLWVSEGLSVYYQDLLLVRAGLMTRDQYLEKMQGAIARFENATGHHYQSATDSSWNTWGTSGVGNDRNTTISYYENGAMLGAMLDLKIRAASGNHKSLDDVMRALYRKYYQEKNRGFADAEFRTECESAAGGDLSEVFSYASTTRAIDYAKYFALAGLTLESTSQDASGAWLPLDTQTRGREIFVVDTRIAELHPGDRIVEVEGKPAAVQSLAALLATRKPDDTIRMKVARGDTSRELTVTLQKNLKQTFTLHPAINPDASQSAILKDWLRNENGRPE
jgi:predicted metalloprotease with PDZ domain